MPRNLKWFCKWLNIKQDSGLPPTVLAVLEEMQEWIEARVARNARISAWEFRERLCDRLKKAAFGESESESKEVIRKTVLDLLHDMDRTELRRTLNLRIVDLDRYPDPGSNPEELLLQRCEASIRRAQTCELLRDVTPADRALLEELFGFTTGEGIPRKDMADKLQLNRNTLDQRLRRVFQSLRLRS